MALPNRPANASLGAVVAPVLRWISDRRNASALRAKTPDQREDIGLTLRDLARIGG